MHAASGWYADPALPGIERYWDGSTWTDERPVPGADHEAVAAAPLWSTVGFELPSYETLARMGADVVAGEETQKPKSARGRRGALKAVSVVVGAVAVATGSFAMVDRHSDANAAVVAAVNSALAGRSADISLSGSGSAAGSSFSITGTGAIDFTEGAMRLSVDVAHGSQQVSAQVIYENKVAYVNLGSALGQIVPGKSWVSLNLRSV